MLPRNDVVIFDERIGAYLAGPTADACRRLFEEYQSTDRKDAFVLALFGRLLLDEALKP